MYYASYVSSDGIETGAGWFPTAAEASRFLARVAASGEDMRDPLVMPAAENAYPPSPRDGAGTGASEQAS